MLLPKLAQEIFAVIGIKITIFFCIKIIIKLYPIFPCRLRRFDWTLARSEQQWAVITGASDGLGFEFARSLAARGYNLLLISRNEVRLEQTKKNILAQIQVSTSVVADSDAARGDGLSTVVLDDEIVFTGETAAETSSSSVIQIRTLAVDFSHLYVYKKIEQFLAPVAADISILINNVGICSPFPELFVKEEAVLHQEMINVNVVAATKMLEMTLPSMVKRQKGLVITVSSTAGTHLAPLNSVFGATKAYLSHLSDSLAVEHQKDGITFATLHPYCVSTKQSHWHEKDMMTPTAEEYVKSALSSIKYTSSVSITGYSGHSLFNCVLRIIEDFTSRATSGRYYMKRLEKVRQKLLMTHQSNLTNGEESTAIRFPQPSSNDWKVLS